MKKILFVLPDLQVGGVTTSFLNLISLLTDKKNEFEISALIMNGDINDSISNEIKILRLQGKAQLWNYSKKTNGYHRNLKYFVIGLCKKVLNRFSLWNRFCFRKNNIDGFDVVIGFKQSPAVLDLVRSIHSKQKICFWHGDPNYMNGIKRWINKLSYVNKVACVSSYVKKQMEDRFPKFKSKYAVVLNNIDSVKLKSLSRQQTFELGANNLNLVTVSRISDGDKNILIIPLIALKLKEAGIIFKWRIVGTGPDLDKLMSLISSCEIQDAVEVIASNNVYGIVKSSDLFVLTSRTESFGMVIIESLLLGTPCVCTNLPSVREIVGNTSGVVFANNTVEDFSITILDILKDKRKYNDLLNKAKSFTYESGKVYNQFLELVSNEAN